MSDIPQSPLSGLPALLQPDNHNKKYEALFVEIDTGQIKLPVRGGLKPRHFGVGHADFMDADRRPGPWRFSAQV